jgi:hypothetical protein
LDKLRAWSCKVRSFLKANQLSRDRPMPSRSD